MQQVVVQGGKKMNQNINRDISKIKTERKKKSDCQPNLYLQFPRCNNTKEKTASTKNIDEIETQQMSEIETGRTPPGEGLTFLSFTQ
jgi:hypothetical protein